MKNARAFFGYGSLVNVQSHTERYDSSRPANVHGWARTWRQERDWPYAVLTAVPAPGKSLQGLVSHLPGADWSTLDAREAGYDRIMTEASGHQVAIYTIPEDRHALRSNPHPILLSYLDVVVQGYHQVFGETGVEAFFATTSRWDTPILNDREAPLYPRAQSLTCEQTALVDAYLTKLPARVDQL